MKKHKINKTIREINAKIGGVAQTLRYIVCGGNDGRHRLKRVSRGSGECPTCSGVQESMNELQQEVAISLRTQHVGGMIAASLELHDVGRGEPAMAGDDAA